jgi:hypothetical protein
MDRVHLIHRGAIAEHGDDRAAARRADAVTSNVQPLPAGWWAIGSHVMTLRDDDGSGRLGRGNGRRYEWRESEDDDDTGCRAGQLVHFETPRRRS